MYNIFYLTSSCHIFLIYLQGKTCDKCLPYFVGDPRNSGQCISCLEYCNGHTDICIDSNNTTTEDPPSEIDDLRMYYRNITEGPKENARCIRCQNLTAGDRCEKCINGKYKTRFSIWYIC